MKWFNRFNFAVETERGNGIDPIGARPVAGVKTDGPDDFVVEIEIVCPSDIRLYHHTLGFVFLESTLTEVTGIVNGGDRFMVALHIDYYPCHRGKSENVH
ncbi:MAG: hypothetical protein ACD_75C00221G0002 [uncultured bacterium]|nr:MAG: hypothetical protein ACD_75C00221G0002 [uncultured bacterium]